VELGLKTLLQVGRHVEVRGLKGKVNWTGDLEAMRRVFGDLLVPRKATPDCEAYQRKKRVLIFQTIA
jgi:hypothetical protein